MTNQALDISIIIQILITRSSVNKQEFAKTQACMMHVHVARFFHGPKFS